MNGETRTLLPHFWGLKGLVPIAISVAAGTAVLISQAEPTNHFGELGGWLVGVLVLAIGALLALGIRDFQAGQRECKEKIDKLEDQVFHRINELSAQIADLRALVAEQAGKQRALDHLGERLADRLAERLLAQKKTTFRRAASDGLDGSGT